MRAVISLKRGRYFTPPLELDEKVTKLPQYKDSLIEQMSAFCHPCSRGPPKEVCRAVIVLRTRDFKTAKKTRRVVRGHHEAT